MGSIFRRADIKNGARSKSAKYFIKYKDETGRWRREAAYTDRAASEQLLSQRERDVARRMTGLLDQYADSRKKSLLQHLVDFEKHLRARGNTTDYVQQTRNRLHHCFAGMKARHFDELKADTAEQFLLKLVEEKGVSPKTRNDYLACVQEFARWAVQSKRWSVDPFSSITRLRQDTRAKAPRRALTEGELLRLIHATENRSWQEYARTHRKVTEGTLERLHRVGRDRAILYQFAALTGLRRNEIKTLRWRNLSLHTSPSTVTVEGRYAKSRRTAEVPLQNELAEQLRRWRLALTKEQRRDLRPDDRVFHVPRHLVDQLRKDLKFAKIPHVSANGERVDFHSLRHTTATLLTRAGVSPRLAQAVLRHSDLSMTMKTYTHLEIMDQVKAVELLPRLSEATATSDPSVPRRASQEGEEGDDPRHHIRHHAADTGRPEMAPDGSDWHSDEEADDDVTAWQDSGLGTGRHELAAVGSENEDGGGGGNRTRVP